MQIAIRQLWAGRSFPRHPRNPDFGCSISCAHPRPPVGRDGRYSTTPSRATRSTVLAFRNVQIHPVLSKGFQELPWAGRRLSGHPWNPDFGGPGRQADLRPCVGRHGRCRVTPPRATRSKVLRFQIGRSLSKVFSKTFFRMLLSSPSNIRDHRHLFLIAGAKPNWGTQVTNPTKSLRLWVLCDVNSNPARAGRGDAA